MLYKLANHTVCVCETTCSPKHQAGQNGALTNSLEVLYKEYFGLANKPIFSHEYIHILDI